MKIARFFWPGLIVALLGFPVALALLQRVPNVSDFEIVQPMPGWPATFVALGNRTSDDGIHSAHKALWLSGPGGLFAHDEIRLLMVTYGSKLTLLRGEIRVPGTDCAYHTRPGAALVNTDYLPFLRTAGCEQLDGDRHELDLIVTFRGEGHVGLATYFVPPAASDPSWLTLTAPDPADARPIPVVRGRYVDHLEGPAVRRADLLAYVWRIGDSSLWIWSALVVAMFMVFTGVTWIGTTGPPSSPRRLSLGVGAIGLGLALLYTALVPPLQAPDEPDHMLSFAEVSGRPQLTDSLAALARRSHFNRIHFHPAEHFRPTDIGQPAPVHWGTDVFSHTVAGRSLTTWFWWKLLAPAVGDASAGVAILAVRLANALVFAASLALATALLLWASGSRVVAPHAVTLALLLVPTLPFFATHVSEFALLTSAYVVLAATVTALFLDGNRVHWLGLPLGLAASCILAGGRSGLPFVATLVAAIGGRALLGSPNLDGRGDLRRSLIFWSGLAIGLAMFAVLSTPDFRAGLWPGDAGQMPDWFRSAAELFRRHPSYLASVIPIGLALELAGTWVRRRIAVPGPLARGTVRFVCAVAAAAVVVSVVLSAFVRYPKLGIIEVTAPSSAGAYALEVLRVAGTGLRIGNHDWLLSQSFWAGFGWGDTIPGNGFISLPVLLTALSLVGLLWHMAATGNFRRAIWLGVLGIGWVVTLLLYAISSYYLHRNLLGRYLVGLFLCILAVCASAAALLPLSRSESWRIRISREGVLLTLAGIIHGYALRFILLRYF